MLLLMPKRKADLFSTDDARRKTARVELERYERLRTTRVAACCEGKGGYFKKSGCRRTCRRIAACGTKIDAKRHSTLRDAESPHRRSIRLQVDAIRHSVRRIAQCSHRISICHQNNRQRMAQSRNWHNGIFKTSGLAFDYYPVTDYANQPELNIGMMDIVCRHCQALLYRDEPKGMCGNRGKLKL